MKRIFLILFLISGLLTHCSLSAQADRHQGYIITETGDTLLGFIDDYGNQTNSAFCDFYRDETSHSKRYFPADLFGYRFDNGKFYISKEVQLEGRDTTLFLEYLLNGRLNIYCFTDGKTAKHYYASRDTSRLAELEYKKEMVNIGGINYEKENKRFVHILTYLTMDDPDLEPKIRSLDQPSPKALVRLGTKYHQDICRDDLCVTYTKDLQSILYFNAESGLKYIRPAFAEKYFNELSGFAGSHTYFGAHLLLNNPSYSDRWYIGLGYMYEGKATLTETGKSGTLFRVPVTILYNPPGKGFRPIALTRLSYRSYGFEKFTSVSYGTGLKYNFRKLFLGVTAEVEFASMIILPIRFMATNVGVSVGVY